MKFFALNEDDGHSQNGEGMFSSSRLIEMVEMVTVGRVEGGGGPFPFHPPAGCTKEMQIYSPFSSSS